MCKACISSDVTGKDLLIMKKRLQVVPDRLCQSPYKCPAVRA
jgi:hypothetical protein